MPLLLVPVLSLLLSSLHIACLCQLLDDDDDDDYYYYYDEEEEEEEKGWRRKYDETRKLRKEPEPLSYMELGFEKRKQTTHNSLDISST
jgi:hypothetical protein